MKLVCTLDRLASGARGEVKEILSSGGLRRRLRDIGVVEGTVIEHLHNGPFGDPRAYLIRGAVISLRSEDSSQILVESCDDNAI
ncbi:MAG: ferrous iron transport protein A [Clostridiales bacterium]|nr:ferrous iron transport protein A [Clostridiales bacterium]